MGLRNTTAIHSNYHRVVNTTCIWYHDTIQSEQRSLLLHMHLYVYVRRNVANLVGMVSSSESGPCFRLLKETSPAKHTKMENKQILHIIIA